MEEEAGKGNTPGFDIRSVARIVKDERTWEVAFQEIGTQLSLISLNIGKN